MNDTVKEATILDEDFKDGLENLVAQLGTSQDKRDASRFVNSKRQLLNSTTSIPSLISFGFHSCSFLAVFYS
jgi:hypothetical protein